MISDTRFHHDVDRLIEALERQAAAAAPVAPQPGDSVQETIPSHTESSQSAKTAVHASPPLSAERPVAPEVVEQAEIHREGEQVISSGAEQRLRARRNPNGSPGQIAAPIDKDVERSYGRLVSRQSDQEPLAVWRDTVVRAWFGPMSDRGGGQLKQQMRLIRPEVPPDYTVANSSTNKDPRSDAESPLGFVRQE